MPKSNLPVRDGRTDFSSLDRRFVFTRDNNGRYFIVDTDRQIRYETGDTDSGSFNAAVQLYGDPLTGVFLSEYRERSATEAFGGPNMMEQVIAGLAPNPLTGRFVGEDPTDVLEGPQQVTTNSGQVFTPPAPPAPAPAPDGSGPSDAFAQVEQILRRIDLAGLIPFAKQQITKGVTADQFLLNLREQDQFRTRFGVIFDLEAQQDQLVPGGGLVEQVQAVLQYENQARELMEDLPGNFRRRDFIHDLLANRVSANELAQRVDEGFIAVRQAPAEVRQAFSDFFGPSGDAALAAYFLDPDTSEEALLDEVRTAQIGGAGAMFGFGVERDMAERLGDFGFTFEQSRAGFSQAAQLRPLGSELTLERDDVTDEDLIGATFGTDPESAEKVRRRQEGRLSPFQGAGAGQVSETGVLGAGSA